MIAEPSCRHVRGPRPRVAGESVRPHPDRSVQATARRTSAETLRTHRADDRVSGSFPFETAVSSASDLHRAHYDRYYRVPNAFKVRPWLFSPLIRTLVRRAAPPQRPSRVFWSPLWTRIAYRLARLFRLGGELIVILTAPDSPARSRSRS
jgi:hypothetical protein